MIDIERAEKIYSYLFRTVEYFKPIWREQSEFIDPQRGYFGKNPEQPRPPNYEKRLNGHASNVLRIVSYGLVGGLCGPSRQWYKAGLDDNELFEYQPVKEWFTLSERLMFDVYARSNYYQTSRFVFEELPLFGTAASAVLPDYDDVIFTKPFTIGQYALGCDKKGRPNAFACEFYKTPEQIVEQFGINKVSQTVKNMYDHGDKYKPLSVKYLLTENYWRDAKKHDNRNMRYSAFYWETGQREFLKISGFENFPIAAPQWRTINPTMPWGYGIAYDILGDVKQMYKMEEDKLLGVAKSVRPPLQKDASVKKVNADPDGITSSSAAHPNAGVRTLYQVNIDLNAVRSAIQDTKNSIDDISLKNLFLAAHQGADVQKTAYEIATKKEEALLILGPVLENLYNDELKPKVKLAWQYAMKANILPPPPPELQGREIKIDFISVLAQAQRMLGLAEIERSLQFKMQLANLPPAQRALDNTDFDEMAIEYDRKLGISPKIIKSLARRDSEREQTAQAAAAQQSGEQMLEMAQGAKTLSDAKLGQGSALDAVIAGAQGV